MHIKQCFKLYTLYTREIWFDKHCSGMKKKFSLDPFCIVFYAVKGAEP